MIQECHTAWFAPRKGLVVTRLVEVRNLEVGRGEVVEVVRLFLSFPLLFSSSSYFTDYEVLCVCLMGGELIW